MYVSVIYSLFALGVSLLKCKAHSYCGLHKNRLWSGYGSTPDSHNLLTFASHCSLNKCIPKSISLTPCSLPPSPTQPYHRIHEAFTRFAAVLWPEI